MAKCTVFSLLDGYDTLGLWFQPTLVSPNIRSLGRYFGLGPNFNYSELFELIVVIDGVDWQNCLLNRLLVVVILMTSTQVVLILPGTSFGMARDLRSSTLLLKLVMGPVRSVIMTGTSQLGL